MARRHLEETSPEHRESFPKTFRLKPEFADHVEARAAFEYATKYKLDPDELNYVGAVIERIPAERNEALDMADWDELSSKAASFSDRLEDRVSCPQCGGSCEFMVLWPTRLGGTKVPCSLCEGRGEVHTNMVALYELGARMRIWRIHVARVGLREGAIAWGTNPAVLARIEMGEISARQHPHYQTIRKEWRLAEELAKANELVPYRDFLKPEGRPDGCGNS